jgi:hypothetical protein
MHAGLEFLFWCLLFALVIGAGIIAMIVERREKPESPWIRSFRERSS